MKDQALKLSFADEKDVLDDPPESISPEFISPSTRSASELPPETPDIALQFDEVGSDDNESRVTRHRGATHDLVSLIEFDGLETDEEDILDPDQDSVELDQSALVLAACEGKAKRIGALCGQGLDKNAQDADGVTPLQMACSVGHVEVVNCLCHLDVDVDKANDRGMTPLCIAIEAGHTEVVCRLCIAGVNVDAITFPMGNTALHMASDRGDMKIVQMLCGVAADIEKANHKGATPLLGASFYGRTKVVQFLCEEGATCETTNEEGWTPLYAACFCGHLGVARYLLSISARPEQSANDGSTPLSIAQHQGHSSVADIVRKCLEVPAQMSSRRVTFADAKRSRASSSHSQFGELPRRKGRPTVFQDNFHEQLQDIFSRNDELQDLIRCLRRENKELRGYLDSSSNGQYALGDGNDGNIQRSILSDGTSVSNEKDERDEIDMFATKSDASLEGESHCELCNLRVGKRYLRPRHHCRACGKCVCAKCSPHSVPLLGKHGLQRVCTVCMEKLHGEVDRMRKSETEELNDEIHSMSGRFETSESQLQKAKNDINKMQDLLDRTQNQQAEKDAHCEQSLTEARLAKDELRQEVNAAISLQMKLTLARSELEDELQQRMNVPLSMQLADSAEHQNQAEKIMKERDRMQEQLMASFASEQEELAVCEIKEAQTLAKDHEILALHRKEEYAEASYLLGRTRQELTESFATCDRQSIELLNALQQLAAFKEQSVSSCGPATIQKENMAKSMRIASVAVQQARDAAGKGFRENVKLREELKDMRGTVLKLEHATQEAAASRGPSITHMLREEALQAKAREATEMRKDVRSKLDQQEHIIESLRFEVESMAHQSRLANALPEELHSFQALADEKVVEMSLLEQGMEESIRKSQEEQWAELHRVENKASQKQSELHGEVAFFKQTCDELREKVQESMEAEYKNRKASEQWRRKHRKMQLQYEELEEQMDATRSRRNSSKLREESTQLNEHRERLAELEEEAQKLALEVCNQSKPQELSNSRALKEEIRAAAHAAQKARISSYEASLLVRWNEDLEEECGKLHDHVRKLGASSDLSTSDFLSPISQAGTVISDSLQTSAFSVHSPQRSGYRGARLRPDSPLLGKNQSPMVQSPMLKLIRPQNT